jgi:hypothetical protein
MELASTSKADFVKHDVTSPQHSHKKPEIQKIIPFCEISTYEVTNYS